MTPPTVNRLARREPIFLALGFVILITISAISIWFVKHVEFGADQVAHTLEVRNKLANLRLLLRRSESSQRGYLLTSDLGYLATYQDDMKAIAPDLDELASTTSDNPRQQDFIAALRPAVNAKIDELRETVRLYQSGDAAGASALVGATGLTLMQEISTVIGRMENEEQRLQSVRTAALDNSSRWLLIVTLTGSIFILVLAATSVLLLRHSLKEQQDANRMLEATNQNLETIVAKRTALLSEANEEVQRFAYIVSHDLRSPLVNIMGFASELEAWRKQIFERLGALRAQVGGEQDSESDEALRSDVEEALSFIKSSIAKMDRLIGALLKLSREGQRQFQPQFIDMSQLLRSTLEAMAHQAQDVNAKIIIGELPTITSDRLALEQVFSNLMDNAVKYLRAGVPGSIEVRATESDGAITYEVHDNGRGIDAKDSERIFDLFRRSGIQDRPGDGIGLAHARALVRRLGGTINVESEPDRGTVFKVTLPKRWPLPVSEMMT